MSTSPVGQKRLYVNEHLKIWFVFLLIFIPAYAAMCYWYYLFTVKREMDFLTSDLTDQLNGMIATMDVENFKALYKQETAKNENCPPKPGTPFDDVKNGYFPEDNPLFLEHMKWIKTIAAFEPERIIYTYVMGPEKDYVITIGSSWYFTNRDQSFKFCQLYKAPNMYKGLYERVDIWRPYHDEYGYWISTFMPIKDKNGKSVGGVGVEVPASQVINFQNDLLRGAATMLLIAIGISFGIAYNLPETISKPPSRFTALTSSEKDKATISNFSGFKLKRGWLSDETDILYEAIQGMISRLNKKNEELAKSRTAMQELAHGVIRAQESERKYISRELHGEVGQLLVILKTSLDDILLELPAAGDAEHPEDINHSISRERLVYAATQIEKTLGVVRAISHRMRPSLLDVGDVNLALNDYCREFAQRQKIEVIWEGFIIPNPPEEVAVSYYRFLQEALTNVSKHSSATRIWVRSQMDEDWIQISVEDNGHGDQSLPSTRGIGIAGLKERFFLLGGTVEADSVPGGFLVVARAPLNRT